MSAEFEAAIKKLAERSKKRASVTQDKASGADSLSVLKEFSEVSKKGADIYNKSVNRDYLKVYELPADFLEIFLGISGRRGGLAVVSDSKLAVFFDEEPDLITVIGKIRSNQGGLQADFNKSLKLLQLGFSRAESGYIYKDNTGSTLSSEDAVAVIFGWLVS